MRRGLFRQAGPRGAVDFFVLKLRRGVALANPRGEIKCHRNSAQDHGTVNGCPMGPHSRRTDGNAGSETNQDEEISIPSGTDMIPEGVSGRTPNRLPNHGQSESFSTVDTQDNAPDQWTRGSWANRPRNTETRQSESLAIRISESLAIRNSTGDSEHQDQSRSRGLSPGFGNDQAPNAKRVPVEREPRIPYNSPL
jgi:hypothetical protein